MSVLIPALKHKFMKSLAIAAAKTSSSLIKVWGMGMGSSLPGKIASTIDPGLLSYLSKQLTGGSLAVTGTNGKSTTSGLLAAILRKADYKIVHNRQGANLVAGITASLANSANLDGSLNAKYGIFEVDEAAFPLFAKQVFCKTVLVTNLFRDQLDRYGELDKTAALIADGIKINNSTAILNADDANVCNLPCPAEKIYYGLSDGSLPVSEQNNYIDRIDDKEISYCPRCNNEIVYKNYGGRTGGWQCAKCDYSRPDLDAYASNIELESSSSSFVLNYKQNKVPIVLPLPGLFNIYNALAAATTAFIMGVDAQNIKYALESYETLFGRSEKIQIDGHTVIIQLIKNPAGATQTIKSLLDAQCSHVIIAINDNLADGRDISWLWDANFDLLEHAQFQFVVSGTRTQDMGLRLKYAGVPSNKIFCQPVLSSALKQALAQSNPGSTIWILPTYTALLELQKLFRGYKLDCWTTRHSY